MLITYLLHNEILVLTCKHKHYLNVMNNLFIIGNGFDLAHGLPTSYENFMVNYLITHINSTDKALFDIDDPLEVLLHNKIDKVKTVRHFFDQFNFHRSNFKGINFKYNSTLVEFLFTNKSGNRWVDIEYQYFNLLGNILNSSSSDENKLLSVQKLNKELFILKEELINYLKKTLNQNPEKCELNMQIKKRLISHQLIPKSSKNLYLNFNYTNLIKNYYPSNLNEIYIDIHGSMDDKIDDIIFGYGDEMDPKIQAIEYKNENEYMKCFKSFGYLQNSKVNSLQLFMGESLFTAVIVGHSCGISDRLLLNSIFSHRNCVKIKILYHQKGEEKNNNDYNDKVMDIYRHFNQADKRMLWKKVEPFDKSVPLLPYKGKTD